MAKVKKRIRNEKLDKLDSLVTLAMASLGMLVVGAAAYEAGLKDGRSEDKTGKE